ncbi:putative aromatic ring hydroxylating dioxygenase beta subunit [Sphingobium chlorophenolicum L-1]|uniref:Putative aromatic ring hydroxylating dioxygenase beta subunit n=1 Tax=Sphingobium chlorophenolicum L-1 TaxID=690566 RepID=F6F222_SPHCR|nr:nuclear transport factor 2 family protein [Sphingobium chlorophenolicum]AEG51588.1 putative aromatic ring hydroxylating dioxygenase beta subunit [Sphingobium chlorophenolicum L-1]
MTDLAILEARLECARIVAAFAYHVDHREFDRAAALFAEDGVFERPDLLATGRAEIAAIWEGRPAHVVTRHLCGIPHFVAIGPEEVETVTYFTLYHLEHEGEGLPKAGPTAVAQFHDRFRLTAEGWLIAHRRGIPAILGA